MRRLGVALRLFVGGEVLAFLAMLFSSVIVEHLLPEDEQTLLEWSGTRGIMDPWTFGIPDEVDHLYMLPVIAFFVVCLLLLIAAWIGLLLYTPWSRWLYLGLAVVNLALTPVMGITIWLPLEYFFFVLGFYCHAGILYLAFVSPLRRRFLPAVPSR